jgi:predicted phosphodiesterase
VGALAELLKSEQVPSTPQKQDGLARTTTIEGAHAAADDVEILTACGHDPSRVSFAAPPSVYKKFRDDGSTAFTTYRYKLQTKVQPVDVEPLIERVKAAKPHKPVGFGGEHWFVFQAGDQQIGKRSRDGSTEQIVEMYLQSVENAVAELWLLKPMGIDGIQVSMPGDCLEGIVSQGGKNAWLTQETITEQFRIFRRLVLQTVERFAPLTDRLFIDVVNGNHDESQRQFNTYPGDGWATEAAIAVGDALTINPEAFGHVTVRVPDKWSSEMTVPVGDTLVTVTHGHDFGGNANKGMQWWKDQAFNGHPAGESHVLQHGHFHEMAVERDGRRIRVQSPTFDCGSDWFRNRRGGGCTRGALTYLLSGGEISRLSLV